jgi:hypothetical protein
MFLWKDEFSRFLLSGIEILFLASASVFLFVESCHIVNGACFSGSKAAGALLSDDGVNAVKPKPV